MNIPGLSDIAKSAVQLFEAAAPIALMAAGVPPGFSDILTNMATKLVGGLMEQAVQQVGNELKLPKFLIREAMDMIKQVVDKAQSPVDQGTADQVCDKYGDQLRQAIDDKICEFKDALKKYMDDKKDSKGGKAPTDFRGLVALLAQVLQKEFENLANKTQAANQALGVATSGKPEDAQKDAATRANQFQATQEVTAESKIFEMCSNMCKAALDGCSGALKTQSQALQG